MLLAAMAATAWVILRGTQLSWDEAVYASKARSLATSVPASHWLLIRPPGLPWLGLLSAPFGFSDASLRLVSAATGIGALAASWALARLLWGWLAGLLSLLVLLTTPTVLGRLPVFRNDLLSIGPVLLLLLLLWWQLERRQAPNAFLLLAGPLAAAAFYLRFGSLSLIVGVGVMALLLWGARLWRYRGLVGGTVLVAVALFVPHVVQAIAETGSPLGIVSSAAATVDTTGPVTAAVHYVAWLPSRIAGRLGFAFVAVAGLFTLAVAWDAIRTRRLTPAARRLVLLLVPAAVGGVGTILVSHPEPRYVMASMMLAVIAGAGGVAAAFELVARRWDVGASRQLAATAVVVAGVLVVNLVVGQHWMEKQVRKARVQSLAQAGAAIAADADGRCLAIAAEIPVVGWYSGCLGVSFAEGVSLTDDSTTPDAPAYVVFDADDEARMKSSMLERYRELTPSSPIATIPAASGSLTVYRLSR